MFITRAVTFAYFLFESIDCFWLGIRMTFNGQVIQIFAKEKNTILKSESVADFKIIFFCRKYLNYLSIKCHSYPKSRTIDGFEQKICKCHSPIHHSFHHLLFSALCLQIRWLPNAPADHRTREPRRPTLQQRDLSAGGLCRALLPHHPLQRPQCRAALQGQGARGEYLKKVEDIYIYK